MHLTYSNVHKSVKLQALPIPAGDSAIESTSTDLAIVNTTAIDTLSEPGSSLRVKRQGGCGCGCGCCCCRPSYSYYGAPSFRSDVVALAAELVAVHDAARVVAHAAVGHVVAAEENLKIKLADKIERESRDALPALEAAYEQSEQLEQSKQTVQPQEPEQPEQSQQPAQPSINKSKDLNEFPFTKPEENAATEWPQPVFELITETYA
ncbi:hypothetical protein NECAME_06995 [Necator americanus]|uniref:Uncharacterized protein n=1 Tax=Necator americanus TaxID=51031 RepID=W2TR72_NECAM|nr:hypothetical protein NECAME_06995 [Necator americanus]ETN84174.1 hypothetical protein NECAME_06995 [Necator americanus]